MPCAPAELDDPGGGSHACGGRPERSPKQPGAVESNKQQAIGQCGRRNRSGAAMEHRERPWRHARQNEQKRPEAHTGRSSPTGHHKFWRCVSLVAIQPGVATLPFPAALPAPSSLKHEARSTTKTHVRASWTMRTPNNPAGKPGKRESRGGPGRFHRRITLVSTESSAQRGVL